MHFHIPSGEAELTERIRLSERKAVFHSLVYIDSYHPINIHLIFKSKTEALFFFLAFPTLKTKEELYSCDIT